MTVLGLGLVLAAVVADLGPLVTVAGMLLAVAGIVKIVMLAIWKSFFAIPVDTPARTDRPPAGGGPSEGKV